MNALCSGLISYVDEGTWPVGWIFPMTLACSSQLRRVRRLVGVEIGHLFA
jgi:hypothetical protein